MNRLCQSSPVRRGPLRLAPTPGAPSGQERLDLHQERDSVLSACSCNSLLILASGFWLLASYCLLATDYFFCATNFLNPSSSVLKSRAACPTRVIRTLRMASPFLRPTSRSAPRSLSRAPRTSRRSPCSSAASGRTCSDPTGRGCPRRRVSRLCWSSSAASESPRLLHVRHDLHRRQPALDVEHLADGRHSAPRPPPRPPPTPGGGPPRPPPG